MEQLAQTKLANSRNNVAIGLTEKGDATPQISTMNHSKDGH